MIIEVETDQQIADCYETLLELRPNIEFESFVSLVREMYSDGYSLVSVSENGEVVALAGYRISCNFALGKKLYVEDLVTRSHARSKGSGGQLLAFLEAKASELGCKVMHLDSGTQRHRAHKFYLTHKFEILAYHFVKQIQFST